MSIKHVLLRLYWILDAQFGIDPRKTIYSLRGLPRYVRDLLHFRTVYFGRLLLKPCLHDWYEEPGMTKDEYFWQDLLVARKIFAANPERHVDIGSSINGFIAHVASFREIEAFDIRPITTQIPGIIFKQADFMKPTVGLKGYCDFLSCLHALEHFGLGRYGDAINPNGFEHGIVNMANLLRRGGVFYLSVPIGCERVEFNANHVFNPRVIINLALKNSLCLSELTVIRQGCRVERISLDELRIDELTKQEYVLGIFTFVKVG